MYASTWICTKMEDLIELRCVNPVDMLKRAHFGSTASSTVEQLEI